jgi:hypothetical protein
LKVSGRLVGLLIGPVAAIVSSRLPRVNGAVW